MAGDPAAVARQLEEIEQWRPLLFNYAFAGAQMAATVFLIGIAVSLPPAWLLRRGAGAAMPAQAARS